MGCPEPDSIVRANPENGTEVNEFLRRSLKDRKIV